MHCIPIRFFLLGEIKLQYLQHQNFSKFIKYAFWFLRKKMLPFLDFQVLSSTKFELTVIFNFAYKKSTFIRDFQ